MEWTAELILSLLEKVKQHESLWNVRSQNYHKKILKRRIWNGICEDLKEDYPGFSNQLTRDGVMAKFTYLCGNYEKLLRKIERTPSGARGKATPKWEFFSACSFLQPVYSSSNNESSVSLPEVVFEGTMDDLQVLDGDASPFVDKPACTPELSPSSPHSSTPSPQSASSSSLAESASNTQLNDHEQSPNIRQRTKKLKTGKDSNLLYEKAIDTLTHIQNIMKEESETKAYSSKEEFSAVNNVRTLLKTIPDSHRNIRIKFHRELLNLITATYDNYYSTLNEN